MINFIINFLNVTNEEPACTTWPPQWNLGQNGIHSKSQTVYIKKAEWSQILPIRSTFKIYLKQILNLIFLVINYSYKKYWKKIKINLGIKVEHFLCLSRESSLSLKEVIVVWKWPLNHSALYTMIFLFFIWYSYPDKLHQTWSVGLRLAAKDVSALSEHPTFRRQGTYLSAANASTRNFINV